MTFDETLYARDDETDEFGDSGAYGDTLEEDYEEEEEEEAEVPGMIEPQPEPATPAPAAPRPSGGGDSPKPAARKPSMISGKASTVCVRSPPPSCNSTMLPPFERACSRTR